MFFSVVQNRRFGKTKIVIFRIRTFLPLKVPKNILFVSRKAKLSVLTDSQRFKKQICNENLSVYTFWTATL